MNMGEDRKVIKKDRDLSVYAFLDVLQKEYMVAMLRYKIYPSEKDKKYFKKVMHFKREKIINLATRNTMPSIFSDIKLFQQIWKKTAKTKGFPDFLYHYEENKIEFAKKDAGYYFKEGEECRVYVGEGEFKRGRIEKFESFSGTVYVVFNANSHGEPFKMSKVNRIL